MSVTPLLEAARVKRDELQSELEILVELPLKEDRVADGFTDEEADKFEKLTKSIKKTDKRIGEFETQEAREAKASKAESEIAGGAVVTRERMTYEPWDGTQSFMRDLAFNSAAHLGYGKEAAAARVRLEQHSKEMDIETRKSSDEERRAFDRFLDREDGSVEKRVNPNTTAGTGGEFVPPLWLVGQYVPFVRADRIVANRVRNLPLPPGIDVINIPKITTGSLTGIQNANAAPVASQDIVTTSVSANVRTIAGQEDISLQLLEQSPIAIDGVVFDDLTRDYSKQLDTQILTGTGSNGQHQGALTLTGSTSNTNISNINLVTCASTVFADASTTGTQLRSVGAAKTFIETLRFDAPTGIWVHPRRANNWEVTAFDTTGRPVYVAYSPFNAFGTVQPNVPQGVAGQLAGLPVVKDANIPTACVTSAVTGGTGDLIAVVKEDDLYLWEGTLRLRALPEILSGTLQIRYQVYAYSAFLPNRFPPSISLITGTTGLAAPTF